MGHKECLLVILRDARKSALLTEKRKFLLPGYEA
jgi:hypothetical protein